MSAFKQFLRNHYLDVGLIIALLGGTFWLGSLSSDIKYIGDQNDVQKTNIESLGDDINGVSHQIERVNGQIEILRDIVIDSKKVSFNIDSPEKLRIALDMFDDKRFQLEGKLKIAKKILEEKNEQGREVASDKIDLIYNKLSKDGPINGVVSSN
ncbi:MAG: hypothetical protein V4596_12190 [Bdellovibrionota bacterium]